MGPATAVVVVLFSGLTIGGLVLLARTLADRWQPRSPAAPDRVRIRVSPAGLAGALVPWAGAPPASALADVHLCLPDISSLALPLVAAAPARPTRGGRRLPWRRSSPADLRAVVEVASVPGGVPGVQVCLDGARGEFLGSWTFPDPGGDPGEADTAVVLRQAPRVAAWLTYTALDALDPVAARRLRQRTGAPTWAAYADFLAGADAFAAGDPASASQAWATAAGMGGAGFTAARLNLAHARLACPDPAAWVDAVLGARALLDQLAGDRSAGTSGRDSSDSGPPVLPGPGLDAPGVAGRGPVLAGIAIVTGLQSLALAAAAAEAGRDVVQAAEDLAEASRRAALELVNTLLADPPPATAAGSAFLDRMRAPAVILLASASAVAAHAAGDKPDVPADASWQGRHPYRSDLRGLRRQLWRIERGHADASPEELLPLLGQEELQQSESRYLLTRLAALSGRHDLAEAWLAGAVAAPADRARAAADPAFTALATTTLAATTAWQREVGVAASTPPMDPSSWADLLARVRPARPRESVAARLRVPPAALAAAGRRMVRGVVPR